MKKLSVLLFSVMIVLSLAVGIIVAIFIPARGNIADCQGPYAEIR